MLVKSTMAKSIVDYEHELVVAARCNDKKLFGYARRKQASVATVAL